MPWRFSARRLTTRRLCASAYETAATSEKLQMSAESTYTIPYKVAKADGCYSFVSDSGVEYIAYFNRHNEISSCPVWEFGFDCNSPKRPPQDLRVRITIKSILADFWTDHDNAILFVCDSTDNKSHNRMKLFNIWFQQLSAGTGVIKTDFPVVGDFCASLLSYSDNPMLPDAIRELGEIFRLMQGLI